MDSNGLYDIYGMWHVPFWQATYFYGTLALLAGGVLLLALWYIIRSYQKRRIAKTSWDIALDELEKVGKHDFVVVGRPKDFYFSVTRILKHYLCMRYGFDLVGKTDEEVVHYLKEVDFPSDILQEIVPLFSGVLTIKFAHGSALRDEMERDLKRSVAIVKGTIPRI